MIEKIVNIFKNNEINISKDEAYKFLVYYEFLVEENKKYNLTAITEFDDVVLKHFVDSSLPYLKLERNATVVDVGSGAGFPGVPLKILRPDLKVVLLDSLNKRVNFLNELINKLNLSQIQAIHARVEDFANINRGKFDYAVSRAVAQTNTLVEYLLPLVKKKGQILLYKSQKIKEELKNAKNAIKLLGGNIDRIEEFQIKDNKRCIVWLEKVFETPKGYPRGKNLPKLKPIC